MTTDPGGSPRSRKVARRRRRRRVAAPLSRIVVAGLSASATFGLVAVMGAVARSDSGTVALDPAAGPAIGLVPPTTLSSVLPTILPTTTRRQVVVVEHLPAESPAAPASASSPALATSPEVAPGVPAPGGALAPAPAAPAAAPAVARNPVTRTKRS